MNRLCVWAMVCCAVMWCAEREESHRLIGCERPINQATRLLKHTTFYWHTVNRRLGWIFRYIWPYWTELSGKSTRMHTKFSIQNNNNRQTKKKPYKVRWCTLANAFCSRKKKKWKSKKKTRRHASNNVEVFIRGILNSAESSLHQIAAWMFTESIFKRFYWLFAVVVVVAVFVVIVSSGSVLESTYISEKEWKKSFGRIKKSATTKFNQKK